LLNRQTASTALMDYGVEIANACYSAYNSDVSRNTSNRDLFVANAMLDILEAVCDDVNITYESSSLIGDEAFVRVTSSGDVYYIIREEEHTTADHEAVDQELLNTYYVTLVSPGTCRYNCHSYAWYSRSTANPYWINDPTPYMSSDLYDLIYLGGLGTQSNSTSIAYGDIIFYGNYRDPSTIDSWHSAVYISNIVSGMPIAGQLCVSKWGAAGVFQHQMGIVPYGYDTLNISAWRAT